MSRPRTATGFVLSVAVTLVGLRKRWLTKGGAAGAVVAGTVTTGLGGYDRAGLLVAFFLSSSALSRASAGRHIAARSGRRDVVQVIANGGVSTLLAATGDERSLLPYLGALAAAAGDTWATEIGSRSAAAPCHVLTGQPVPAGTSGGVSLLGTVASLAGGAFMGTFALAASRMRASMPVRSHYLIATGIVAGMAGSLVDSLLGATLQERRWCARCQAYTERPVHSCGQETTVAGGIPGVNNDVVNLLCTVTGALVGYLMRAMSERATRQ